MTDIVHFLRTWRYYFLGSRFVVKTDNVATRYFQMQKKLTPKQTRWQDFLAEFYCVLEYKPCKGSVVAELGAITSTRCQTTYQLANQGNTRHFWVKDGLLLTTGQRFYVPKFGDIRRRIIREIQDTMWAGHLDKVEQQQPRGLLEPLPVVEPP
uniref:Reverse transcriptase RNase H-like domain-containing protein n=1 Tax=Nicotiana tabacum TaxID=4097 RepID=A0A1S3XCM9_TOBAC|nr:PREDICTED: uncharacterized protein LOC107763697 [Nicotiana tabacum]